MILVVPAVGGEEEVSPRRKTVAARQSLGDRGLRPGERRTVGGAGGELRNGNPPRRDAEPLDERPPRVVGHGADMRRPRQRLIEEPPPLGLDRGREELGEKLVLDVGQRDHVAKLPELGTDEAGERIGELAIEAMQIAERPAIGPARGTAAERGTQPPGERAAQPAHIRSG